MHRHAWLTPDLNVFSAPVNCREIHLPGDLFQYITGALLPLTRPDSWESHGTATPEQAAEFFTQVLAEYFNSMCAYVGEIRPFAIDSLPPGWLLMDGTAVSVTDYPGLAAVVPSAWVFGGDIHLPDMTGRSLVGAGSGYALGSAGGEEEHALTIAEMPSHSHSYEIAVLTVDIAGELPAPALDALAPASTGSTGGNDPHNNMPPFLVINWGIYAGV